MSTQPPPAKRRRIDLFEGFCVTLGQDDEQKTITVAKTYLTKSSDYLKKACNKEWKEGQMKTIELPDIKPDTFAIYVQWLQTGELVLSAEELPARDAERSTIVTHWDVLQPKIVDLYILVDYLANTIVRNLAIDEWKSATHALKFGPSISEVKVVYEKTPPKCMLRKLMVDWSVAGVQSEWITNNGTNLPAEFLADVFAEWTRLRGEKEWPQAPYEREKCYYHEHDEERLKFT
ncbi:hypothetical protein CLAFUW4_06652 [Fulvia fulva]|uniref:BTB domain-containing protein n=1 Tax=Passalora fulva TaxID=5499 RepID=A0A9Q8UQY5_PASFU|nr:uncharacterized protein CLAFUR5_06796 [Fulvia fulva]KAK4622247.1 hypothetical protein CLAFUR4_06660 [Fulvia fulva]KAK4622911.1 hypothetical protein CLAFUR0_06654 [Fulvia fulva]UJO19152.1 hypothetical protein CLAFUR5_06796 [Fulvia fulva]WPV16094.1 hypothetical protein CLAFUW4_06652 [Fulvia fulva]WPV31717.1 hypothetical protein CLAFUW7_06651 [Fulvia fulva]